MDDLDEKVNPYTIQEQIAIKQNLEFYAKVRKVKDAFNDKGMESEIIIIHDEINIRIDSDDEVEAVKIIEDIGLWAAVLK